MVEFAIPSIIGLVVNGLYMIINSIFLGYSVGSVGVAVSTIAMPIMLFSMSVGVLIGGGGNALIALRLGEGKIKDAQKVLGNALTLTIIAAVICTLGVYVFEGPILRLSGATGEVWAESSLFIRIIAGGFILQFFGMGFNNFIRTAGDPNRALYTMVAGTVVCIAANFLLVMVLHLGFVGSATATLTGQAVTAVMVFWYFAFSKKAPFKLLARNMRLKLHFVRMILVLGSASFVLQVSAAVINLLSNSHLVALGATTPLGSQGALVAFGVAYRVATFVLFPIQGVATAALPLFGYNYGATHYHRVKKTFQVALIWVISIGVFFWVLIHVIPGPIAGLFSVKADLLTFTTRALTVQLFMMPVLGIQTISSTYFQASGQPLKSMFLSLTRQILFLIPLIFVMPYIFTLLVPGAMPLEGFFYAFPVADGMSILVSIAFMTVEIRKLNRKIHLQNKPQPVIEAA